MRVVRERETKRDGELVMITIFSLFSSLREKKGIGGVMTGVVAKCIVVVSNYRWYCAFVAGRLRGGAKYRVSLVWSCVVWWVWEGGWSRSLFEDEGVRCRHRRRMNTSMLLLEGGQQPD